ncbi:MraY family glycosyltransferase [Synechococcus sp. MIT S9451]|uniref:MraY family glycosyltransferase n=1 Tax=Synechococcus sp. MIT S9451 TaxID=3082543 RepID=UPI0039B4ED87
MSLFFSCAFLFYFIPILRRFVVDTPNHRSSHLLATPTAGGISFVIPPVILSLFFANHTGTSPTFAIISLLLPLAAVGFIDDLINLPSPLRYIVQFLTSVAILKYSPFDYLFDDIYSILFLLLLLVSCTTIINFVNFMDGLDGLVAGCMFVAFATANLYFHLPWTSWCLVGSLFGFLIWNWSPAKVFMGDTGSTFLGALFASYVLNSTGLLESIAFLLILTPLLADSLSCLFRRFLAGHSIFQAHRLHLYQRLNQAGWSHSLVATLYISATLILSVPFFFGFFHLVILLALLEIFLAFFLDRTSAYPFPPVHSS